MATQRKSNPMATPTPTTQAPSKAPSKPSKVPSTEPTTKVPATTEDASTDAPEALPNVPEGFYMVQVDKEVRYKIKGADKGGRAVVGQVPVFLPYLEGMPQPSVTDPKTGYPIYEPPSLGLVYATFAAELAAKLGRLYTVAGPAELDKAQDPKEAFTISAKPEQALPESWDEVIALLTQRRANAGQQAAIIGSYKRLLDALSGHYLGATQADELAEVVLKPQQAAKMLQAISPAAGSQPNVDALALQLSMAFSHQSPEREQANLGALAAILIDVAEAFNETEGLSLGAEMLRSISEGAISAYNARLTAEDDETDF